MDRNRVRFLRIVLIIAVSVIAVRLFYIQIIQHDEYVAKAAEAHISETTIPAKRGEIYMMDGENAVPVVLNETVYTVIFDPLIVDEEKSKEVLEKYVKEQIVADFDEVFKDKTRRYYVVARNVNYQNAKKIEEEELSGVTFEQTTKRVYVEGEMASQTLGFVNSDGIGQYGVEGAFDEELSGEDGTLKTVRDASGVALSIGEDNIKTPAKDGENIVLTIDRNIQTKVEKILAEHIKNSTATHASAIVLDPKTGKIWAMANVPNYDPGNYGNVEDASAYQNNILEGAYEAASVCKTFTFAAAIDLGVMNPDTTYYNSGNMTVDTLNFRNAYTGLLGTVTMQQAFDYSLNTGSATALQLIGGGSFNEEGRKKLYDYLQKFGLGKNTGVGLYEVPGFVPEPNQYDYTMDFTYANMTFGQGMNLTMMQVAAAIAGIINDGQYHRPTIVEGMMTDDGMKKNKTEEQDQEKKLVSAETSATIRQMMHGTRKVQKWGEGDRPGYYIGGKTGTGQIIQEDGKYSDASYSGETIGSFVGFGSASEDELPQYVVMVKAWGAGQYIDGGKDAGKIFDSISNYMIDYLKIQAKV